MPLAALALLAASCVLGPKPMLPRNVTAGGFCASPYTPDSRRSRSLADDDNGLPASVAVARRYASQTLDIARALGLLDLVERLAEARDRGASETEISNLRGEIFDATSLVKLDLASAVAQIECEAARAGEIAAKLRDAEAAQTNRLTAFSLVLSAAAAVASGTLDLADQNQTAASIVGIGGGVVGGALGFATLAVHRTADFRHDPNMLGEFWYGNRHPDFPETVWVYLTRPQFGTDHERSRREALIAGWRASGRLGADPARPSSEAIALYFGSGGIYDADDLETRARMLIEVRDVIDLMNHDLRQLETDVAFP
jgi:hypothetical protein